MANIEFIESRFGISRVHLCESLEYLSGNKVTYVSRILGSLFGLSQIDSRDLLRVLDIHDIIEIQTNQDRHKIVVFQLWFKIDVKGKL